MEKKKTHYGLSFSDSDESDSDESCSSNEEQIGLHSPPGCLTSLFVDSCVKDITLGTKETFSSSYNTHDSTHINEMNRFSLNAEHYLDLKRDAGYVIDEELVIVDHYKDILAKEMQFEDMLSNSSALKLEQLRNVEILRQRSLQESERCREMELIQEEKIRSSYIAALQKILYNREIASDATDSQLKRFLSTNSQPLTLEAVKSHLERQVDVDVGAFGQKLHAQLKSVLEEHNRLVEFVRKLGNNNPSDTILDELKRMLESGIIRRFISGGCPEVLSIQKRLDAWVIERTERLRCEAEAEKKRLETIAEEERLRIAEEAREYARLQSQEKSKAIAHLKLFSFDSTEIRGSTDRLKMQTAAVGAKLKRAESSIDNAFRSKIEQISGKIRSVINLYSEVGSVSVASPTYCEDVMDLCHGIDALIKQNSSSGDIIVYILYQIFAQSVIGSVVRGSDSAGTEEAHLRAMNTASFVVYGLQQMLGGSLQAVSKQIISVLLFERAQAVCIPNFSSLLNSVASESAVNEEFDVLDDLLKPKAKPQGENTDGRDYQQQYQVIIRRKAGDSIGFLASFMRFPPNTAISVFNASDGYNWFVQVCQQLLFLLSLKEAGGEGGKAINVNPNMWVLLIDYCCYSMRSFLSIATPHLVAAFHQAFVEFTYQVTASCRKELDDIKQYVSDSKQDKLSTYVDVASRTLEKLLGDVLEPICRANFSFVLQVGANVKSTAIGQTHVLVAYALVGSLKRFQDVAIQLEEHPTPEDAYMLSEVVQVDKLDGAILNQLGQSAASQSRVLDGIVSTLSRAGDSATMLNYTLYKVANIAVKQSGSQFFAADKHALPLARVVCMLCKANPLINELVVAQFYQSCPLTIPNMFDCDWHKLSALLLPGIQQSPQTEQLFPHGSEVREKAFQTLRGMGFELSAKKAESACFELRTKWLTRMMKIFTTYCMVMVQPEGTPVGMSVCWSWLSNCVRGCMQTKLSTLPFMVALTLDTFLRVTSAALYKTYGKEVFVSTLQLITDHILPKLDVSDGKLKIEAKRLEELLRTSIKNCTCNADPVFKGI